MLRLFAGIRLPESTQDGLAGLCSGLHGARWVRRENLHITLRFIGEVGEGLAQDLDEAFSAVKAPRFDLHIKGLGTFGPERAPRQLWAGVAGGEDALQRLAAKVEKSCVVCGLPAEQRKFIPHVTLARFKGRAPHGLGDFISGNALYKSPAFTVEEFVLFSSRLSKDGPIYREEATYPLKAV